MTYWVEVHVQNPTNLDHTFTIPKGRMISPKKLGFTKSIQNLVVTASTTVRVPAKGKVIVVVPTDCTDPSYPPPNNTPMDITVFGQKHHTTNAFATR